MSRGYRLSATARRQLDGILEYVLRHGGVGAAKRVAGEFARTLALLGEQPGIGHRREDLTAQAVRFWPLWSYLIIYRDEVRPIEVVRIEHGARQLEDLLG